MSDGMRATQHEIFSHVRKWVGDQAITVSLKVSDEYINRDKKLALEMMKEYDATLGGIGIYRGGGLKLPGIYRALSYNEIPMIHGYAHECGRFMIHSSFAYLEGLIKKLVHLWPWEIFKVEGLPLGTLVKKIEKRLPDDLAQELWWLNKHVYVYAKHNFDLQKEREARKSLDHYFALEEAIAVYFLVRILGTQLEALSGKPIELFLEGWELLAWDGKNDRR
jgi:hypothetical protein